MLKGAQEKTFLFETFLFFQLDNPPFFPLGKFLSGVLFTF